MLLYIFCVNVTFCGVTTITGRKREPNFVYTYLACLMIFFRVKTSFMYFAEAEIGRRSCRLILFDCSRGWIRHDVKIWSHLHRQHRNIIYLKRMYWDKVYWTGLWHRKLRHIRICYWNRSKFTVLSWRPWIECHLAWQFPSAFTLNSLFLAKVIKTPRNLIPRVLSYRFLRTESEKTW